MQKWILAVASIAVAGAALFTWVDAEVERRVAVAVAAATSRAAANATWENRRPSPEEELEAYAAQVAMAKKRLEIRGVVDPEPLDISLEMSMMRRAAVRERPLIEVPQTVPQAR